MSTAAHRPSWSPFEQLRYGRDVLRTEGEAILGMAERLGDEFCQAIDLMWACSGDVIVTGMGKAGHIGQKITATLASTGTRSHFLHPAEAVHGDLGRVRRGDVVLAFSFSGETEEVTRILPTLRAQEVPIVAVTGRPRSSLANAATVTIDLGPLREACPLGLAPSTSTTTMLAVGDALALVMSRMRGFQAGDFARYHPAGALGRKLARVDDLMRPLNECRLGEERQTVREVFVSLGRPGRRTGAIMLVDDQGILSGVFTDSDLAKLLERKMDAALDGPIREVMTRSPQTVLSGTPIPEAVEVLAARRISELPVVDRAGQPVGLLDITDVVTLLPRALSPATFASTLTSSPNAQAGVRDAEMLAETIAFPNLRSGSSRT